MKWKKTIDIKKHMKIGQTLTNEDVPEIMNNIANDLSDEPCFDHLIDELRGCSTKEEADGYLETVYNVADSEGIWLGL